MTLLLLFLLVTGILTPNTIVLFVFIWCDLIALGLAIANAKS